MGRHPAQRPFFATRCRHSFTNLACSGRFWHFLAQSAYSGLFCQAVEQARTGQAGGISPSVRSPCLVAAGLPSASCEPGCGLSRPRLVGSSPYVGGYCFDSTRLPGAAVCLFVTFPGHGCLHQGMICKYLYVCTYTLQKYLSWCSMSCNTGKRMTRKDLFFSVSPSWAVNVAASTHRCRMGGGPGKPL